MRHSIQPLPILLLMTTLSGAPAAADSVSVRELGATGSGDTVVTAALQRAIDTCAETGGGTVYVPAGTYRTGTVSLRDHITLHLEPGALLIASTNIADFPPFAANDVPEFPEMRALVRADGVGDVTIEGGGIIDGSRDAFQDHPLDERPVMGVYRNCTNIALRDVTIRNSACWSQYFYACDKLAVRGVKIRTYFCEDTRNWGKDGIDIIECRNVTISDCDIEAGDDCICLKSTTDAFCENITVTNCILKTYAQALKMGTSSTGGFRNITMSNCAIYDTFSAGIDLMVVDGGLLENVLISDIVMRNVGGAISIRLGNRGKTNHPDLPKPGVGTLRQVTIRNVRATGVDSIGCAITGIPGHPLEDIVLEDINIEFAGGGTRSDAVRAIPELEETYPFYKMFGTLPAYGFFVRHADGIRMENVRVFTARDDLRPPYVFDDVRGLELEGITGTVHPEAWTCIRLAGVRDAFVHGCVAPGSEVFLSLENGTEGVAVLNNDLSRSGQPIRCGDGIAESAFHEAFNRMPQSGKKARTEPKSGQQSRDSYIIDY